MPTSLTVIFSSPDSIHLCAVDVLQTLYYHHPREGGGRATYGVSTSYTTTASDLCVQQEDVRNTLSVPTFAGISDDIPETRQAQTRRARHMRH